MSVITYTLLKGREIRLMIPVLGALRLEVFREYPYLYEGTQAEERSYLQTYADSPSSLVVLAMAGDRAVGATTCLRMSEAEPAFRRCFDESGMDTQRICYLGESVLLPAFRGRGIGKAFFAHREKHARELGTEMTAFCAVDRAPEHPQRPPDYRPLDGFWSAQGYTKQPQMQATFIWKEIQEEVESPKTLTFWTKPLL